jgi:hypothetical protein
VLGNETALLNRDSIYGKEMPLDLNRKVDLVAGVAVEDAIFWKVLNYTWEDSRVYNEEQLAKSNLNLEEREAELGKYKTFER